MASFRGKYIRVERDTYYSKTKSQEDTIEYTRNLLYILLRTLDHCEHRTEHRKVIHDYIEGKEQELEAARILSEELKGKQSL
jgi:hypothetical protein